jgi:hypothetical protein
MTQILGRPTDRSITVNVLASSDIESFVEYGVSPGKYTAKTAPKESKSGQPFEIELDGLNPNTRYYYRLRFRQPGATGHLTGAECSFHTQRPPGSTFTFALQGDSHPERYGRMYDPDLYVLTMNNVSRDQPDFYVTLGDDFSIDRLINRNTLGQSNVDQVYAYQRTFLGIVGRSSPLFLVNGNHEQAARHMLDGTPNNPAVLAGRARTRFYSLPAPDAFYSGDFERVDFVGLLRDYYAWTWGDALFVVMDPYWHSPVPVDSAVGGSRRQRDSGDTRRQRGSNDTRGQRNFDGTRRRGASGRRNRDWWGMSIGDAQYQWLKKTLEQSKARYKFVFAHHVLGTGRGGIEMADRYEWGGRNRDGAWEFGEKRPGWALPIHQLMVKTGVTIFFQGHDHLFARQERDGVVYQETPNPADASYQAFNREAYRSGDILPNSGHLRVTVSPQNVRVDYVRSYLPKDETPEHENGEVAFSYTVKPAAPAQSGVFRPGSSFGLAADPQGTGSCRYPAAVGRMFWLSRNRFVGSYLSLSSTSRR